MELTAAYRDIYKRPHSPGACHCATRDKLHATCRTRPEPRPLLYCLHDTRTWTTTASSVCTLLFSTICSLLDCILYPTLTTNEKHRSTDWESLFTFSSRFEYLIDFYNLRQHTSSFGNNRPRRVNQRKNLERTALFQRIQFHKTCLVS